MWSDDLAGSGEPGRALACGIPKPRAAASAEADGTQGDQINGRHILLIPR